MGGPLQARPHAGNWGGSSELPVLELRDVGAGSPLVQDRDQAPVHKGVADPQPAHLLVVQLGLHLAEAVRLLGLVAGDVGQELKQVVAATAEGVVLGPGALQALGPAGQSQPGL